VKEKEEEEEELIVKFNHIDDELKHTHTQQRNILWLHLLTWVTFSKQSGCPCKDGAVVEDAEVRVEVGERLWADPN
jgi:hypothetical protein